MSKDAQQITEMMFNDHGEFVGMAQSEQIASQWNPDKARDLPYLVGDLGYIANDMKERIAAGELKDTFEMKAHFDAERAPHNFMVMRIEKLGLQSEFAPYLEVYGNVSEMFKTIINAPTTGEKLKTLEIMGESIRRTWDQLPELATQFVTKTAETAIASAGPAIAAGMGGVAMGIIVPVAMIAGIAWVAGSVLKKTIE